MQTAEGAVAPRIVNGQVGKLKVFTFQIQRTRACAIELFDKVTNVREPSSVCHNLKLGRIFWLVEGVFTVFVLNWQGNLDSTYYLHLWHPRQWNSGTHHMVVIVIMCNWKCSGKYTWYGASQPKFCYILPASELCGCSALSLVLHGCTSGFWTSSINSHHADQT